MIAREMWLKLQTIASCSEGVFCPATLANTQVERATLNQIIAHNKAMFELIRKERAAIYRLTGIFYSRYKLPYPKLLFRQLSAAEILSRCIWSAFIIENDLLKVNSDSSFIFNGQQVMLDNFCDLDKYTCNSVLTCEDRYGFFAAKELPCIVPSSCLSKWVRQLFSELFAELLIEEETNSDLIAELKGQQVMIPKENVLENGIWPKSKEECHEDKRYYGSLGNFTGVEKWDMDLSILPLWIKDRKSYKNIKFGIYRRT